MFVATILSHDSYGENIAQIIFNASTMISVTPFLFLVSGNAPETTLTTTVNIE